MSYPHYFNIESFSSFYHQILSSIDTDDVEIFSTIFHKYNGTEVIGKHSLNEWVILLGSQNILSFLLSNDSWNILNVILASKKKDYLSYIIRHTELFNTNIVGFIFSCFSKTCLSEQKLKRIAYMLVKAGRKENLIALLNLFNIKINYSIFSKLLFKIKQEDSNNFKNQLEAIILLSKYIEPTSRCFSYFLKQLSSDRQYVDAYFYQNTPWKDYIINECLSIRLLKYMNTHQHLYGFIYDDNVLNMDFLGFISTYIKPDFNPDIHKLNINALEKAISSLNDYSNKYDYSLSKRIEENLKILLSKVKK